MMPRFRFDPKHQTGGLWPVKDRFFSFPKSWETLEKQSSSRRTAKLHCVCVYHTTALSRGKQSRRAHAAKLTYPCKLRAGQHELRMLQCRLGGSRPVRERKGWRHLTALLHLSLQEEQTQKKSEGECKVRTRRQNVLKHEFTSTSKIITGSGNTSIWE